MICLTTTFVLIIALVKLLCLEDCFAASVSYRGIGTHYKSHKGRFRERHYLHKAAKSDRPGERYSSSVPVRPHVSDMIEAMRHLARVTPEMTCAAPRQRVLRISACYPDINGGEIYPSSTVLYECSDASGCCGHATNKLGPASFHGTRDGDDDLICAATEQDIVTLYFYLYDDHGSRRVQTLTFINHTLCSCVERPPGYSQAVHQPELLCPPQYLSLDEAMGLPRK